MVLKPADIIKILRCGAVLGLAKLEIEGLKAEFGRDSAESLENTGMPCDLGRIEAPKAPDPAKTRPNPAMLAEIRAAGQAFSDYFDQEPPQQPFADVKEPPHG